MPTSRKRRTRPNSPPSEEDKAHLRRSIDAGARGDLAASLEHEVSGSIVLESPHRFFVKDLLDQGDAAPPWAYSRWCVDLAYRSLLLTGDDRVSYAVGFVMNTLHPGSVAAVRDDPLDLKTFGTQVAAGDGLAVDLALYELGGLAHFLDQHAQPGLLERTDRIQEWAQARPGVYSFVDVRGCRLVFHDMVADAQVDVLNLGALSGQDEGFLVGRLVPITAEPGWMFVDRPILVDCGTALDVADALRGDEPLEWLLALAGAVSAGRLEEGFHCVGGVSFTSDLPELAAAVALPAWDGAATPAECSRPA